MKYQAPAKVNLGLAVHGRRPDGYHDISTIFLKISLTDTLLFEAIPRDIIVHCTDPSIPSDERNLVYKAARLLHPLAPDQGVRVYLDKRIPAAAGLGGGSSDAATTLLALNRLWHLHLTPRELMQYAVQLGADVPFFLLPAPAALGRGRGDQLEPLPCPQDFSLIVVTPHIAVSTAWVYAQLRLALTAERNNTTITTILRDAFVSGDIAKVGATCFNDLEEVVLQQVPVVREAKRALMRTGIYGVCMSGSGPTVYALCPTRKLAQEIALAIRSAQWDVWVCHPWRSGEPR